MEKKSQPIDNRANAIFSGLMITNSVTVGLSERSEISDYEICDFLSLATYQVSALRKD